MHVAIVMIKRWDLTDKRNHMIILASYKDNTYFGCLAPHSHGHAVFPIICGAIGRSKTICVAIFMRLRFCC